MPIMNQASMTSGSSRSTSSSSARLSRTLRRLVSVRSPVPSRRQLVEEANLVLRIGATRSRVRRIGDERADVAERGEALAGLGIDVRRGQRAPVFLKSLRASAAARSSDRRALAGPVTGSSLSCGSRSRS